MTMKLWKISQDQLSGYDTYDSAIVAAESADQARLIHPEGFDMNIAYAYGCVPVWTNNPADVTVVLIGTAVRGTMTGVILASVNAG